MNADMVLDSRLRGNDMAERCSNGQVVAEWTLPAPVKATNMSGSGKRSLWSLLMALTQIPRAIGKLRLPLPPIISLERMTAYTHLDSGG